MDFKARGKLLVAIERERRRLYKIAEGASKNSKELIQASQRLDRLLVKYLKS